MAQISVHACCENASRERSSRATTHTVAVKKKFPFRFRRTTVQRYTVAQGTVHKRMRNGTERCALRALPYRTVPFSHIIKLRYNRFHKQRNTFFRTKSSSLISCEKLVARRFQVFCPSKTTGHDDHVTKESAEDSSDAN